MGEYANIKGTGEMVKLGTCEDMYYIRADQRDLVNYDFDSDVFRFRFPFPDEDKMQPGEFESYERSLRVNIPVPSDVGHTTIQMSNPKGLLMSIPCPETLTEFGGQRVHKNGYNGGVGIAQQRAKDGKLMLILTCRTCGCKWRLETIEDCKDVLEALEDQAVQYEKTNDCANGGADNLREIARRIVSGYNQ